MLVKYIHSCVINFHGMSGQSGCEADTLMLSFSRGSYDSACRSEEKDAQGIGPLSLTIFIYLAVCTTGLDEDLY